MELKTIPSNERLNFVLQYLNQEYETLEQPDLDEWGYRSKSDIVLAIYNGDTPHIPRDLDLILEYLEEVEEYITKSDFAPANFPTEIKYRILYAGKVFIENGGYVGKNARDLADMNRAEKYERYMGNGAMGAAIMAFLYLFWLIFSYGLDHNWWFASCCHCH